MVKKRLGNDHYITSTSWKHYTLADVYSFRVALNNSGERKSSLLVELYSTSEYPLCLGWKIVRSTNLYQLISSNEWFSQMVKELERMELEIWLKGGLWNRYMDDPLEWGKGMKYLWVCVCTQLLSRVLLFATPWTVAHQAPLSMGFSRQEYWSGLPSSPPGDLPYPRIKLASPMPLALQADSLPLSHKGSSMKYLYPMWIPTKKHHCRGSQW